MWYFVIAVVIAMIARNLYMRFVVRPGSLVKRRLPNGMDIVGCSGDSLEDIVYHENFVDRTYFRSGISVDSKSVVVDVGANIGLFTLSLLKEYPGIKSHCVEPVPVLYEACKQNVERYALAHGNIDDVKCHCVGLGETECTVPFRYNPQASAGSSMFADEAFVSMKSKSPIGWICAIIDDFTLCGALPKSFRGLGTILRTPVVGPCVALALTPVWIVLVLWVLASKVPIQTFDAKITTLDKILKADGVDRVDLLKVDVEGAELLVMKSISREAFSRIRQIVVEVHDIDNRTNLITTLLKDNGFTVTKEVEEHLATHKLLNIDTLYALRK